MSNPEIPQEHPIWEGALVGFLFAAEKGLIPRDQIIPQMGQVCVELMKGGMLNNFGELQTYLRKRGAYVQLVAQPFVQSEMPQPNIRCVDPVTNESRNHWLMVSAGPDGAEVTAQLQRLSMSHEVNEATLANNTGMLVI